MDGHQDYRFGSINTRSVMRRDIFRKAALEKLSTPEQLDTLMGVTRPAGWMALITTAILLAGVVTWSVFGYLRVTVPARGILIRGGTLIDVQAGSAGRISEFLVKSGDVVKAGDEVAVIAQREMVEETSNLRKRIDDLERENVRRTADETALRQSKLEVWDAEEIKISAQVRELTAQIPTLQTELDSTEAGLKKGLATRANVLQAQQALLMAQNQIKEHVQRLRDIPTDRKNLLNQMEQDHASRMSQIADLRRQLETKERALASANHVRAHAGGRVLERAVDVGDLVTAQTRVLSLEPLDVPLLAILYVPAGEGKSIAEKFEVRLSPSTVRKEEYGVMMGTVRSISSYPATPEGMLRTLRNQALVTELSSQGAPLEVVAELESDPETVSGYRWSSPSGPPVGIFGGTLCTASIVTEMRRPISYVIPFLKKSFSVE
jgi:HlyD family secretion protein